jgi:aspartate kinase
MMTAPMITTVNDITLITLQNCPSDLAFTAGVFQKIAGFGVDVDMIALAPTQGAHTSISFTISDNELGRILAFTSDLHDNAHIKTVVSSGNCKISVYDQGMKECPGVAARVFAAAAKAGTDIRIITTSEVDISLLVTAADFNDTLQAIEDELKQ